MAETWFRNADARYPFFWSSDRQPPARWHGAGDGPAQYLATTPDGAWAEFLRHEEITDSAELEGIRRTIWAVELELGDESLAEPELPARVLVGGRVSHARCQAEARRLRATGATGLLAPSAALVPGGARGQRVDGQSLVEADDRDGQTLVLFGPRPQARAWMAADRGGPSPRTLGLVRHDR
ncbi:MAG: RES family NAD+ phosphorylase [Gaiellaceae bacterium]